MKIDVMTSSGRWTDVADQARALEASGFSGMLFTETSQTPWMAIASAATAAPSLDFSTGIAVAFPRSPMIAASVAWELAENTEGKFRLGLGSQVRAHVERRYSTEFNSPGPRMRDYVEAVKACLRAFRGEEKLHHEGPYYNLSLLPDAWKPRQHSFGDIKVDVSAVGPYMTKMANEVADGIHVHPFHSMRYLQDHLIPAAPNVDLMIPVFTVVGDTADEQQELKRQAKQQIAFYGSTRNYGFQFELLGFEGMSGRLNERMKAGDIDGMTDLITDEMLEQYAVVSSWADLADKLIDRYRNSAERIVLYQAEGSIRNNPPALDKWRLVAEAVRAA